MTADDVKVGQIVTVLDWFCNQAKEEWTEADPYLSMFGRGKTSNHRRDYMGMVLRVEAVSLPYVALTVAFTKQHVTLDLRQCEIAQVTPDFIAAAHAHHKAAAKAARVQFQSPLGIVYEVTSAAGTADDDEDDDS